MSALKGACIIAQSGGPTSVINASAYGAISASLASDCITKVYGAAHGIRGVLDDRLYVMDEEDPAELARLKNTPSSALGSCRYKLKDPDVDDSDYRRILEIFQKYDIRYFFYNGGNDSMDTCNKISKFMLKNGYECRVMGIPKTIDNDLFGTDHCPGYGSAAKYVATSTMEVYHDATVYDYGMVTILEIMGRHAGWLAAASAIAAQHGMGPDLIYLPEIPFDCETFFADVEKVYKATGKCIVAISEGIAAADGKLMVEKFAEGTDVARDSFGHAQLFGVGTTLANMVKARLGCKTRCVEFSLAQRCAAHLASQTDVDEAFLAGQKAVEYAVAGVTDKMVGFHCSRENGYTCEIELLDLTVVANTEKKIPREWINEAGNGLKQAYIDYALPLIAGEARPEFENGVPRFARLKKIIAE